MVDASLARCQELRCSLAGLAAAREALLPFEFSSDSLWGNYHRGLLSALCGDPAAARTSFDALLAVDFDAPWVTALKQQTRELAALLGERQRLEARVRDLIALTRAAKGLPSMPWTW